ALELAALALPVADRILDEFERRVLPEITDREDRLEHGLQPGVLALRGQAVHLQEPFVGLLLNFDQVRDRDRRLDLREIDALAADVPRRAVHAFPSPRRPHAPAGKEELPADERPGRLTRRGDRAWLTQTDGLKPVGYLISSYLTSTFAPASSNFF